MDNLFIELLQVSLGNREQLSRSPSEKEWMELLTIAEQQTVTCLLLSGIEHLPNSQWPPQKTLLQWIGLTHMIDETYLLHCHRARELAERFQAAGFRSCVLKGIGLAQLYPQPEKRQGGDIDLWVTGERKDVMKWLHTQCQVGTVIWHHVDAEFFEDVPTEIHFHPCWMYNPFCNRRLQRWFESQKGEQMNVDSQLGVAFPSVRFNAVYALVHAYHHLIEEGLGMRHVVDYYYVAKALPAEDRGHVVERLRKFGMLRLAAGMMWVLKEVCGMPAEDLICEPNERAGRFLLDEIERGGNFGHYRNDGRQRNSVGRLMALLPHYPREVLWVVPWKIWHRSWMVFHKND